jgi:ankyrin repeat protein
MTDETIEQFCRAVKNGDTTTVTLMIGQDPTLVHSYSIYNYARPIHVAIRFGKQDVLKILLQFDCNLAKYRTSKDSQPLIIAANYSNMKAFDILITCLGQRKTVLKQLDIRDGAGRTAMHYAAIKGNTVLIERIISLGSTAHMIHPKYKTSVMHLAVQNDQHEVVNTLMMCGCNVLDSKDGDGWTPMHYVQNALMLETLVRWGSNALNIRSNYGYTPVQSKLYMMSRILLITFLVLGGSDCITEYHNWCELRGIQTTTWTINEELDIRFRTYFAHSLVYRLLFMSS